MSDNTSKPRVSDEIDKNLRLAYEEVLKEELPDRFTNLLEQLRSGQAPDNSTNGGANSPDAGEQADG